MHRFTSNSNVAPFIIENQCVSGLGVLGTPKTMSHRLLHLDEETREPVGVISALFFWKVTASTDTRDGAVSVLHGRMVNSVHQIRDKRLRDIFFHSVPSCTKKHLAVLLLC